MRESKLTIVVVAGVCLVLLVKLVTFSVPVHKTAVLYRWNEPKKIIRPPVTKTVEASEMPVPEGLPPDVEVVNEAGWFFKWPYPIDTVKEADQWVRTLDGPLTQIQLPDGNQVLPRIYVTWRIVDPVGFERALQSDERVAARRLRTILSDQTATVFGNHVLADIVNTQPEQLKFDKIEQEIFEGVKRSLASREQSYGIEVCSLGIAWVALPESTTQAVFARMQEERNTQAERLRAEGDRIKRTKIAEAREEAERVMAEAEAEAKNIRADAEARAATYYDTFAEDETLAIFLRRLDAIRKITADAAANGRPLTFVVSTQTEPFSLFEQGIEGPSDVEALTEDMARLEDAAAPDLASADKE
ncbi:MAG: SPFH domain-containing protein [Candidatus Brocadiia bacterium]